MKERVRIRKRRFLAFLLAVTIGMLLATSVFANTYKVTRSGDTTEYFLNVALNDNEFLQGAGYPNGTTGNAYFYGVPGDEIRVAASDCKKTGGALNVTLTYNNTAGTACTAETGATVPSLDYVDPSTTAGDEYYKLLLPGKNTFQDFDSDNDGTKEDYAWKITITDGSANLINGITCELTNVFNIRYYDEDGTDISTLVDNKQIFVPVVSNFTTLVVYDVPLKPYNNGKTFDGWYTAPTGGTKVIDIISYYDANTNTSKVGCNMDSDRLPTENLVQDTGVYKLYGRWSGGGFTPTPGGDEPEPDPGIITYYPDNILNLPEEEEIYESEISLPKNIFRPNPGQMFEGWQVADTEQDPIVGTGEIYKPGTVFKVKDGMAFIAVWKDNPTFKIECDEEYILTPPDNTINNLTSLIRMSSEITYYEDGEEPEQGDTEKEKKTYIKGTAIPSSQLEVVIDDPKAIRKVGTFPAKIVYKGLYNRTIEKTVSVTVLDPNVPTYDSFSITDVTKVGTVVIDYPSSIAYHGDKWDKAKSLVKVTDDTTKVIKKKVKNSDLTGLKPGDSGKFTMITVKVKENKKIGINKKESRKLTKKVNHRIKAAMKANTKTITIRSLIVMPELINNVSASGDKLKSVSLVLDDKTMVTIKEDSFTVDEANQVVNFTGNYGGNLTFEELELSSTSAK